MLIFHIQRLDASSLARRVYEEQAKQQWPGLAMEGDKILRELGMESVHSSRLDNKEYREIVTKSVTS